VTPAFEAEPVEPGFDVFAAAYARGEPQVVWRRRIDDVETPVSALLKLGPDAAYRFLFESVEGGAWRGRYSILALDPDLVWRAWGAAAEIAEGADAVTAERFTAQAADTLTSLRELVERSRIALPPGLPPMAAGLFGVLGYDTIRLVEPLPPPNPDPLDLPDAVMMRPRIVAVFDGVANEILIVTPVRPEPGLDARAAYAAARARLDALGAALDRPLPARAPPPSGPAPAAPVSATTDRAGYHALVERAREYIAAGDIFQVVPSQRMSLPAPHPPFAVYRALRRLNPSPFLYFLNFGGFQLAGSSPEILVRLRDGKVTIRPIAGTRRRGATPEEDRALEAELLADPKERAEHLMLLDLGRNDVGRALRLGERAGENAPSVAEVTVTQSFVIERYSHVMHIVSNVEGATTAAQPLDPVDVILTALPAGTLSGAPKVRAMQIIDELERVKRGVGYGGAAGYISCTGEVDTAIVLRTALFKDGVMHVQAGGGVVADSDPDAEYEETLHKARALMRAAEEAWRFDGG
jgi:anthranilate synthase component 1